MGWQTGGFPAVTLAGDITALLIPGDLDGNGFVGGSNYSEVLGYWDTGTPLEAVPEPATLGMRVVGGLLLLSRR